MTSFVIASISPGLVTSQATTVTDPPCAGAAAAGAAFSAGWPDVAPVSLAGAAFSVGAGDPAPHAARLAVAPARANHLMRRRRVIGLAMVHRTPSLPNERTSRRRRWPFSGQPSRVVAGPAYQQPARPTAVQAATASVGETTTARLFSPTTRSPR